MEEDPSPSTNELQPLEIVPLVEGSEEEDDEERMVRKKPSRFVWCLVLFFATFVSFLALALHSRTPKPKSFVFHPFPVDPDSPWKRETLSQWPIESMALADETLILGSPSENIVRRVSLQSHKVFSLAGQSGFGKHVAASHDKLAISSTDGDVWVYRNVNNDNDPESLDCRYGCQAQFAGHLLAVSRQFLNRIQLYDTRNWDTLNYIQGDATKSDMGDRFALSATRLAVGYLLNRPGVQVYDINTLEPVGSFLAAGTGFTLQTGISGDGQRVAVVGSDATDLTTRTPTFVRIYQFEHNDWTQVGDDIPAWSSRTPARVAISQTGDVVAVCDTDVDRGLVSVHRWNGRSWTTERLATSGRCESVALSSSSSIENVVVAQGYHFVDMFTKVD